MKSKNLRRTGVILFLFLSFAVVRLHAREDAGTDTYLFDIVFR